ncbi:MAG: ASKHA domain-containing protein [Desulfobacula sp.]|uniref:ASKHA domain-containing protein n=1 Tax=Desulfobacula sp. TaxID=2593537 RepID=UPI0025C5B4C3|nr:ASKHA domain-containing protein [Desulfobacula sp.]MCD4719255.1 ASKHA domain-containing protein [Desulfobacula sp.]
MGKCINHPDRETSYICMKHNIYLCEECLECRDPDIYCKFRSSCPIYFITKKGFESSEEKPVEKESVKEECIVIFEPGEKKVAVTPGTNLLEASQKTDIHINASCNGKGSCGKCKLIIESGKVDSEKTSLLSDKEKEKGYVLACQSKIFENIIVKIPEETIEKKLKAAGMGETATKKLSGLVEKIEPIVEKVPLQLDLPTMEDTISDFDRLKRQLKKLGYDTSKMSTNIRVMRQLTESVRDDEWKVIASVLWKKCSSEIVDVTPANNQKASFGMAVDLGTTSIVVYIVDMADGAILSTASGHNRQAACGDDVINRIVCSEKDGIKKLKKMAISTINDLTKQAISSINADHKQIESIVISGNTTMIHLLLGINAKYIRREPYIPTVSEFPIIKAGEIGLKAAYYAGVFIMPGPASYVGGDIVSGVLYTGFNQFEDIILFIDIGTNGEIVLGNNEFLMTAACSAGPAFEGGGIRWGMRAEDGAIEKITLDPKTFEPEYFTVENKPVRGICGSGMIDLLSEMLLKKVIGQDGKFQIAADHPRFILFNEEPGFIIEFADNIDSEENIIFTQSDIKSLILSKAAIYAGFSILLEQVGMDFSSISQMIITGGFGQYLNIEKAITIGLLPDIEREKFKYMGNSSIAGAYMALLSNTYRQQAIAISNAMTYLDFSSNNTFMEEFTRAQFLPHTDANLFPSVHVHAN